MNKKLFLLAMCILASSSMVSARISKKKLYTKICATQSAVNCLCKSINTLEGSVNSLEDSVETIESRVDVIDHENDLLESRIDILEEIAGTPISETTTIDSPGNYIVQEDFNGCIIIDASDVTLNLNDRTITSNCGRVITVNTGLTNVVIENGTLIGNNTDTRGIFLNTNTTDCTIYGVNIAQCNIGIDVNTAEKILIEHCIIKDCILYGINFFNSNTCEIKYCQVLDIDTTSLFIAFRTFHNSLGGDITFFNCIIKNITSTSGFRGFELGSSTGNEATGISIDNCKVENINTTSAAGVRISAKQVNITNCLITKLTTFTAVYGIFLLASNSENLYAVNNVITKFTSTTGNTKGINTTNSDNNNYIANNRIEGMSAAAAGSAIDTGDNAQVVLNASINSGPNPGAIRVNGALITSGEKGNVIKP